MNEELQQPHSNRPRPTVCAQLTRMERCNRLHNNGPFLCYDSAQRLRRHGPCVRICDAHAYVTYLNVRAAFAKVWDDSHNVDLTSGTEFNWRGYLATHCDTWYEALFHEHVATSHRSDWGQRITKFEARLFYVDHGEGPERNFAFIAHRADGRMLKIQPGRSGATEGWPIIWDGETGRSSAYTARPARANHSAIPHRNPLSTTNDEDGQVFLHSRVQEWEHSMIVRGHAPSFATDLTKGDVFAWNSFLNRDKESRELIDKGVVECWLVWVGRERQRAAFYFRFHDGAETVYATTNDGRWVSGERLVEDVYWAA